LQKGAIHLGMAPFYLIKNTSIDDFNHEIKEYHTIHLKYAKQPSSTDKKRNNGH